MEIDHIQPSATGGGDTMDNAIPLCFECHAEVHMYNPRHPKGRRFRPSVLKMHRDQWLEMCQTGLVSFEQTGERYDVGPLEAMIDELEFNASVAAHSDPVEIGSSLADDQFLRATQAGCLSAMNADLRATIFDAYRLARRANELVSRAIATPPGSLNHVGFLALARDALGAAGHKMTEARRGLMEALQL